MLRKVQLTAGLLVLASILACGGRTKTAPVATRTEPGVRPPASSQADTPRRVEPRRPTGDDTTKPLTISAPKDGAMVPERPIVQGKVRDPAARVWVVVHPMAVTDKWVQPSATVGDDGAWAVQVYIGRPGSVDEGKYFEIRAFVNPDAQLSDGEILGDWPAAQWKSQIIRVMRKVTQ